LAPLRKCDQTDLNHRRQNFLQTLADSRLTIKSATRTYRFKAVTVAGKTDDGSELHGLAESIARFR